MVSTQWQLADNAALRYEEILVPAILGPFAKALVDWAELVEGDTVVDVGSGTGAAARFAAPKVGNSGHIIGTDVNAGMLNVAQALSPIQGAAITWQEAAADNLSMADETIDTVLCAQTLQFVGQKQDALSEMHRVLKGGRSAYLSLWCEIEHNPYFDALVSTIAEYIGADTAAGLGSAFKLSNLGDIYLLLEDSAFSDVEICISERILYLPPIHKFVPRHIRATPMGVGYDAASESTQEAILDSLSEKLKKYQTDTGIEVPFRSFLIRAKK